MRKNKKEEKGKKKCKVWMIVGGIILVLVFAICLIPKLLFTDYDGLPTTGKYKVKQESVIFIDEKRLEIFETDGSNREIPAYFYYPDIEETNGDEFPLVIFSHGAFGYYQSNTSTYMELASHGYIVVSLEHPYHSIFTKDTSGKLITVNKKFMQDVMYVNEENVSEQEIIELSHEWLELRMEDMNFVLDSLKSAKEKRELQEDVWYLPEESKKENMIHILNITDTEKIGLMGHSLGGAASVTLGRTREDIDAVINLDGTMLGEQFGYDSDSGNYEFYNEAYPVPLLFIGNEPHHLEREKVGELYVNNVVLENAVDCKYTYFVGSGHMNFTDLPLFSPKLAALLGTGEVDAETCIVKMNEIILEYYNCYLKEEGTVIIEEKY